MRLYQSIGVNALAVDKEYRSSIGRRIGNTEKPKALIDWDAEEKDNCEIYLSKEFKLLENLKIVLGLGKIGFDSCVSFFKKNHNFYLYFHPVQMVR